MLPPPKKKGKSHYIDKYLSSEAPIVKAIPGSGLTRACAGFGMRCGNEKNQKETVQEGTLKMQKKKRSGNLITECRAQEDS